MPPATRPCLEARKNASISRPLGRQPRHLSHSSRPPRLRVLASKGEREMHEREILEEGRWSIPADEPLVLTYGDVGYVSVSWRFCPCPVSYTHLRAHETGRNIVCRL